MYYVYVIRLRMVGVTAYGCVQRVARTRHCSSIPKHTTRRTMADPASSDQIVHIVESCAIVCDRVLVCCCVCVSVCVCMHNINDKQTDVKCRLMVTL